MSIKNLALTLTALAAMAPALFAQTTTTATTRSFHFPPLSLGSNEVLEVNVANVATNSSNGTAASCSGTISFTNASGSAVGGTPAGFTLSSGQISAGRLTGLGSTSRPQFRAAIQLNIPTTTPRPPCALEFTLEIYDATTGATHAVVTGFGELTTFGR